MDSQLPALLEKIGFLPADVARAAAAEKDPVGFCLRRLSRDGRVGQAFEALLSTDLALSVADRLPDWCRRAEEMIVAAKAGIPPDTVELARKAPSVRERRTPRRPGDDAPTPLAPGPEEDTAREEDAAPAPGRPVTRPAQAVPPDSPSALPDRYEVVGLLGKGGMGTVYEVADRELGRTVALKILGARTEIATKRFLAEVRATAKLEHPNILPSYTVDVDRAGRLYFTMMKIAGKTFREAMESESLETCVRALEKAARGVAHAHRQGILHRDIKPGNIMLGGHGEVWVLDWGLVAAKGESLVDTHIEDETGPEALTRAGVTIGTPGYMAPEQAEAGKAHVGPPADVHGLGAVLYELLTEERPYGGQTSGEVIHQMSLGPPPPPDDTVPRPLAAIAMKALAQKPPNRYPSADAFADDLAAFLARQPVSAYRAPVPIRIVAWVRRHVVLFSIAVVVSLAVGATIGIVYGRNSLESRATQAREGEAKRAAEKRLADARSGRDLALEAAKKAHEARLGALRDYSEPFEHVFVYPPPPEEPIESQRELLRQLAKTTYNPSADFWVAKASEDWQAAAAQARSSLLTLRERNDSLDAQELEWALELALATERALFTSAWIEKSRQTAKLDPEAGPRFYRQVVQLLADIEKPDRLGPDHAMVLRARELLKGSGKLTTSPLPADTTAKLLEYVTTQFPAFGREVVSENISPAGESVNLPLGSYSLEVARGEERFFFPVLVERGRTSSVEVELPEQIPEGFAWIPPGDFLEGGDAPDAWPRHRCFLEKGFFLARTEVTLERYIEFLRRVPDDRTREAFAPAYYDGHQLYPVLHADLSFIRPYDELEHPVYGVSRVDAEAYAKWLSENDPAFDYRLPSEEEWARAAAGADGRILVWGDHFDKSLAIVQGNGKYEYRGPVGSSPADSSPFGIFDMAGNLSEWTASDLPGERAVVRGACWGDAESAVRVSGRNLSHARNEKGYVETGFRLVAFPKRGG